MDKYKLGLEQPPIPDSPAKRHMANVLAGRAVVAALTQGMPPIENVSMKPRGGKQSRILFQPQEYGRDGDAWHALSYGSRLVNAVEPHKPLSTFDFLKVTLRRQTAGSVGSVRVPDLPPSACVRDDFSELRFAWCSRLSV
eukprot:scaffold69366_cov37-Prasinocladus_malaysianus.AAC.1